MAEWVGQTQAELGAVISAPKLTEKLLGRPPFRFLHDIITNFIKANQFPVGYFSDAEMDSGKVSSKEDKLAFITKSIQVVEIAIGRPTAAKPAKILAGAEAENTSDFLRMLAQCAALSQAQKDSAVRKALGGGDEPPAQEAPPAPAPAPAPEPAREEPPAPKPEPVQQPPAQQAPPPQAEQPPVPQPLQPQPVERPGTATARKPPPATRNNEMVEDRSAPTQVAGVIVDNRGKEKDDEDENKEKDWMKIVEEQENAAARAASGANDDQEAQGYLAKKAQEAKRAQEEEAARQAAAQRAAGDEGLVLNVKSRSKDRQSGSMGESEMGKLREQLQMLTKASNPLGKFLEAIHEDMDTMSRELEMWKTEARTQAAAATEAQRQTEEALHSINSQLTAIDGNINDQLLKINIARATILQNDKTIETMLRMVVNPDHAKKR